MGLTNADIARLKSLQRDIDSFDRKITDLNEKTAHELVTIARKKNEMLRASSQGTKDRLNREIHACNMRITSNNQQISSQSSTRLRKVQEHYKIANK
ncbi:hypothetical protein [Kosakonia sacchari]